MLGSGAQAEITSPTFYIPVFRYFPRGVEAKKERTRDGWKSHGYLCEIPTGSVTRGDYCIPMASLPFVAIRASFPFRDDPSLCLATEGITSRWNRA